MAQTKEERNRVSKEYRAKNIAKVREWDRKKYLKNKENILLRAQKYKTDNPDIIKEGAKKARAKARESLKDYLVIDALVKQGFPKGAITPELIELKRITIKTKRLCRQLKA